MRAVIFLFAFVFAKDDTKTWEMLEDLKANQYTATTNFEMHRAETENLRDWRDMRTKCSGALDHYMSQQYPNIQTLLNDMVNDDDTWFTHAMAFDALKQHQLDMGITGTATSGTPTSNSLPYNSGPQPEPAPEPKPEPKPAPKPEPCHCEAETEDTCESEKCAEWCYLIDDKEDICYMNENNHIEFEHFYTETQCLAHGGNFIPNDPECRGVMVWTADPSKCYDDMGYGLSADECAQFPEDCHMQKAGVCGPIENVHEEWTPCMYMDGMSEGCYELNNEEGSTDRCYWMPECANGAVVGAAGDEGCDPLFCEGGDCPDWCDPMRIQNTNTGEWQACHEITDEQECGVHSNACAWELHGVCEPPNAENDSCHQLDPDQCKKKADKGVCIAETHDFGKKCIAKE